MVTGTVGCITHCNCGLLLLHAQNTRLFELVPLFVRCGRILRAIDNLSNAVLEVNFLAYFPLLVCYV